MSATYSKSFGRTQVGLGSQQCVVDRRTGPGPAGPDSSVGRLNSLIISCLSNATQLSRALARYNVSTEVILNGKGQEFYHICADRLLSPAVFECHFDTLLVNHSSLTTTDSDIKIPPQLQGALESISALSKPQWRPYTKGFAFSRK